MATFVLMDDQHVELTIAAVDDAGNPTTLTSVPTWAVSDDTVLTVTPSADGMSADLVAVGKLGSSQVSVSAVIDADHPPISGTLDVNVVASGAVSITITPGTPAHK